MKNTKVYIVAVVSLLLCVGMIAVVLGFTSKLAGDVDIASKDIATYGQWDLSEKYTKLLIFPQQVPESAEEPTYVYHYQDGYNRPMCQIYLHCELNQADYDSEVQRLSQLSYTTENGQSNQIVFNDQDYLYPAYVAIEGYDFCYEFALVDEENLSITYIYAMNTIDDNIEFEKAYLPEFFMEDFENFEVTGFDRFTMYERYGNE